MTCGTRGSLRRYFIWALAAFAAASTFGGCGEKGPPRPPAATLPAPVTDLQPRLQGNRLILQWSIPEDAGGSSAGPAVYRVLGARAALAEADCRDCLPPFEPLVEMPAVPGRTMRFESELQPGFRYVFKVVGVSEDGQAGAASNTVDFNF
jgi:hypothetical protein